MQPAENARRDFAMETEEKLNSIESAISQVESVKKQLNQNANKVKSQIQSCVSRHLESLRSREVWLLNQVDTIQDAKDEVLHTQEARLSKTLGILQNSLEYSNRQDVLGSKLAENLKRVDLRDLRPEETPCISFRSVPAKLQDTIMSYGRVLPTGLPMPSAFVDHGHPSTCLPRHFEDYEDQEHHVLYKTLEAVNRANTNDGSIHVTIPKLQATNWLTSSSSVTKKPETLPQIIFPKLNPDPALWLSPGSKANVDRKLRADASIQNWLQQIKQSPDLEEDYEVVEQPLSSGSDISDSVEMVSVPKSDIAWSALTPAFVHQKPTKWLQETQGAQENTSQEGQVEGAFKYFQEIKARDNKKWLIDHQNRQLKNSTECCGGQCSKPIGMDIENLDSLACGVLAVPKYSLNWLQKTSQLAEPDLNAVCKANEPCKDFGECVSQPSCRVSNWTKNREPSSKWLTTFKSMNQSGEKEVHVPVLKHVSMKQSDWLVGNESSPNSTTNMTHPVFDCFRKSMTTKEWLLRRKQPSSNKNSLIDSPDEFSLNHNGRNAASWLARVSDPALNLTSEEKDMDVELMDRFNQVLMTKDWLLSKEDSVDEAVQIKRRKLMEPMKKELNWLSEIMVLPDEKNDAFACSEKSDVFRPFREKTLNAKWLVNGQA